MTESMDLPPLLSRIARPSDVRAFNDDELGRLVDEVRETIIHTAAANGGHLAPHLGVVELAVALHHVFETERDPIIWDVGHQCYPHKLLTGRAGQIATVRKRGGLSGYPKRSESPFDAFGVGHSSTSISAGLGMSIARDLLDDDRRVVAVIGDGAMTAGMAFEALAHAGHVGSDLLVILNDNKMSISPNVGALSAYFSRLITGGLYNRAREDINQLMRHVLGQQFSKAAQRLEHSVKGMLVPGTIFEELGFKYVGPVDGHDLPTLVDCFKNLRHIRGPVFFHCVTKKGKGYGYAEDDPVTYHGVKEFDVETGKFKSVSSAPPAPTFTDVFADTLIEEARDDQRIVGITAAMPGGTGLARFEKAFPGRFFDVGICEQHAVTLSAGMATQGLKPVCAIYSTFMQRAYDQYLHDVCLQNLPVVFAIDRAGAVGEDSPTQQGAFDLSFLRAVPNVTVLAPRDAEDLRAMMRWALAQDTPVALRYGRCRANPIGAEDGRDVTAGEVLRDGDDATILGVGPCLAEALAAAEALEEEGVSVGVCDARRVKPLDEELVLRLAGRPILTLEENTVAGGFGSAVLELLNAHGRLADTRVAMAGFPDAFIDHGTRNEQLAEIGLDCEGLKQAVKVLVEQTASQPARTV
jgi:1-deoxy-D-xylulose-5-phosphate synthase